MKLSIVIVNYNVEYFLEQCLYSVEKAMDKEQTEVWVVDNASVDGSVGMISEKFPWVNLIELETNLGFSCGNNVALRKATGQYVLLLNPDTVVEEDTFEKCIEFMDKTPEAGGLGVKMLDGNGHYLPESKRGLPTPWVSFYKIFGFTRLFPHSARFARYYLGHLSHDQTHDIEILSGAYMFLRKSVLDKIGLLDEDFFMYGEDIDLSYRILKAGNKNYYYPDTRIIHYKGESTKKGSINYVMVFYQAMIIFAKKHFSGNHAKTYRLVINIAIYLRAALAIISRFIKRTFLPVLDFVIIFGLLYQTKNVYEYFSGIHYPEWLLIRSFSLYALVWMLSVLFAGGYDKPVKLVNIIKGLLVGSIIILAGYSLLPESMRFSRAIILLGSGIILLFYMISRVVLSLFNVRGYFYFRAKIKRISIVGEQSEIDRVESILHQTGHGQLEVIKVSGSSEFDKDQFVGSIDQLIDVSKVYGINEVIYCARNLSSNRIINSMAELDPHIDCKIAPPESLYIIGSNAIESSGEMYMLDVNSINRPANRRNKRTLDVVLSLLFILTYPLLFLWIKNPMAFLQNIFLVFFGLKTWVGYAQHPKLDNSGLPSLKNGVLNPVIDQLPLDDYKYIQKLNVIYAKDYRLSADFGIIFKNLSKLGNTKPL